MTKNLLYIGNKLKAKGKNPSGIDVLGPLLEQEGMTLYFASSKQSKLLRFLDMVWTCLKYYNKVDYVLIDTYSTLNFYYAYGISQLCKVLNLNYIPILHGGNLIDRLQSNPKLSQSIFSNAYKNVAPSLYIKEKFELMGYNNIIYIPNTIRLSDYTYKPRTLEDLNLLWVRSFAEIYNPKLAVQVLKQLMDRGYKATLTMVGPDSEDGSLYKVKQLAENLGVTVNVTGKLSKADWHELSKNHNVFINTTNYDNMPVSVIEAMALGLPIVSTNVGGLPYLITHEVDGMLVPPDNIESMSNAILRLKNDSNLVSTLTLNARHKVEAFDWQVVKRLWFELLN